MTSTARWHCAAVVAVMIAALGARWAAAQTETAPASRPSLAAIQVVTASHCDVGFTDTPAHVAVTRVKTIEEAIGASEADPTFRWTLEVGWDVDLFLAAHPPGDAWRARLKAALARRQLSIGALYVNAHLFLMGPLLAEIACHLELCQEALGFRPTVALLNDVPRAPRELVDVLSSRGVKYLLWGPNDSFTAPAPLPRNRPFVWVGPRGGRVTTYILDGSYTNGFDRWLIDAPLARFFGNADARRIAEDVPLTRFGITRESRSVPAWCSIACTSHSLDNWTAGPAVRLNAWLQVWNATGGGPPIHLATPEEFFAEVERRYGTRLETSTADMTGSWELVRANMPMRTATLRERVFSFGRGAFGPVPALRQAVLAFDHNLGGGPTWARNFDRASSIQHNREAEELTRWPALPEVTLGFPGDRCDWDPTELLPFNGSHHCDLIAGALSEAVSPVIARCGLAPSLAKGRKLDWPAEVLIGTNDRLYCRVNCVRAGILDREGFPADAQVDVGWRLPLTWRRADVHWQGLPAGEGQWVAATAPVLVGRDQKLAIRSRPGFSWMIEDDPARPGLALLSGLIFRHAEQTLDRKGKPLRLAFGELFPGEPESFPAALEIEASPR